ncbi:hypothetical protein [Desulfobacula sp.]
MTDVSSFSKRNQPGNSFPPPVDIENNLKFHYQVNPSNSVPESLDLAKSLKHVDVMTGNQPLQKIKAIEFLCTFSEAVFNG